MDAFYEFITATDASFGGPLNLFSYIRTGLSFVHLPTNGRMHFTDLSRTRTLNLVVLLFYTDGRTHTHTRTSTAERTHVQTQSKHGQII